MIAGEPQQSPGSGNDPVRGRRERRNFRSGKGSAVTHPVGPMANSALSLRRSEAGKSSYAEKTTQRRNHPNRPEM